ncbi:hypothetical protein QFC21_005912 [Naganishia friedmannii]|uniref:Uncharacterized protein n=1 Tax=Naganishia friedmannii TaxID=89922 RepID=A0ACC2V6Y4_9TREE|nr:hypothetical protein QFC21_005912 [Naganishia friedmannii]
MSIPGANLSLGTSVLPTTSGLGHVLGSTGGATICSGATASSSPPLTMTGKSNALSTTTTRKKRVRAKRPKAAETQKFTLRGSVAMVGMCQPGCEPAKFSPAQGREQEDIKSGEADCHARYASPASRSCGTYVRYIQLKVGEEWPVEKAFSIRAGYYDEYKAFYAFQITVCAHAGYGEAYPAIIGPEGRHMHEMIWSKGPNAVSEPDLDAGEEIRKKLRRLVKSWLKEEHAKWLWIVINFLFGAHLKTFLQMGKEKPSCQVKSANNQPAH